MLKLMADAIRIIELQLAITRCRACAYGGKHGCRAALMGMLRLFPAESDSNQCESEECDS